MPAIHTPPSPPTPAEMPVPDRLPSSDPVRQVLTALAAFVGIAGIGLAISLVTGATILFNMLVFALFAVLWIAFAAAIAFSPATLDEVWHAMRSLPLLMQGVVVLLFLPVVIGLWIWERTWSLSVRLVLVLGVGAWTFYMLFPRTQ